MSYTHLTREFINLIHWNVDHLFNYFDLDNLDLIKNEDLLQSSSFLNKLTQLFHYYTYNAFYFYYPFLQSFKELLGNIFSFNWITNFSNLSLSYNRTIETILHEEIFFKNQFFEGLDIIQLPVYTDNKLFLGILNSVFLALPNSCNQIICIYRFIGQGPRFGLIGLLGWLLGQCSLFACILFGVKPIIIQWFSLEPLSYFLNIYLITIFLYNVIHNKKIELDLNKIIAMHFILSWTEEGQLFSYLSNINMGIEPNVLDISSSNFFSDYLVIHTTYILGILIGCTIFSLLYTKIIFGLILNSYNIYCNINETIQEKIKGEREEKTKTEIEDEIDQRIEFVLKITKFNFIVFILALTISSLSNYDVSYLITNPLGFNPQDKSLSKILLNPNSDDPMPVGFGSRKDAPYDQDNDYMYLDLLSLDDKEYKNILEFEDINYGAEYAWMSKVDKIGGHQTRLRNTKSYDLKEKGIKNVIIEQDNVENSKSNKNVSYLNVNNIDDFKLDENYIHKNNTQFSFNRSVMDANFKLDFIPFNKYNFVQDVIDQRALELELEIKQKYYINTLYKSLLNFEVDNLISRQPNESRLLEFEENDIYRKRNALSNYYESNYYYAKMNHFDLFRKAFFNSKSYLNNSYNQQFAGTLRIVERLFEITLQNNHNNRSVLKYDYPLFSRNNKDNYIHEELYLDNNLIEKNYKGLMNSSSSPLFITWNEDLHHLVITNNILLKKLITTNDTYIPHLSKNDTFIFGPMSIFNMQKLSNIVRKSYSIVQSPSLKKIFYPSNESYLLDSFEFNDEDQLYLTKLSVENKPQKTNIQSVNSINWYSFRYNINEYLTDLNNRNSSNSNNQSKKEQIQDDLIYRITKEELEGR